MNKTAYNTILLHVKVIFLLAFHVYFHIFAIFITLEMMRYRNRIVFFSGHVWLLQLQAKILLIHQVSRGYTIAYLLHAEHWRVWRVHLTRKWRCLRDFSSTQLVCDVWKRHQKCCQSWRWPPRPLLLSSGPRLCSLILPRPWDMALPNSYLHPNSSYFE